MMNEKQELENLAQITDCLDFHKIKHYLIKCLDENVQRYSALFPISAQDTSILMLENMEKYLLEYFKSVKLSIDDSNIVMVMIK